MSASHFQRILPRHIAGFAFVPEIAHDRAQGVTIASCNCENPREFRILNQTALLRRNVLAAFILFIAEVFDETLATCEPGRANRFEYFFIGDSENVLYPIPRRPFPGVRSIADDQCEQPRRLRRSLDFEIRPRANERPKRYQNVCEKRRAIGLRMPLDRPNDFAWETVQRRIIEDRPRVASPHSGLKLDPVTAFPIPTRKRESESWSIRRTSSLLMLRLHFERA
ncbi:MAG: hypothetical protein WCC84_17025 [Candidatus Cybelea sp.]